MIYILMILNIILFFGIGFFYCKNRMRTRHLDYISDKLNDIIEMDSGERLMLPETDAGIRRLMSGINRLLNEYQQLSVLNREKEASLKKMISNISHDLKTPLTVIMGYIETMILKQSGNGRLPDESLTRIYKKSQDMTAFINKFFEMSKIESGDTDLLMERIDITAVCRTNILSFYDMLKQSKKEVNVEIPDNAVYILGNEDALERILNNLILNALKYGVDGDTVGLCVTEVEDRVVVEVWDNGRGIDEAHIDHVFDRMYTLDDSRNSATGGSGLGLSITKKLTEHLGGEVEFFGNKSKIRKNEIYKRIGCLIGVPTFYNTLSLRGNLKLHCDYMGYYNREDIDRALQLTGLTEFAEFHIKDCSIGQLQSLGIARAIVTRAELLILNDPFSGLEPDGVRDMRNLLQMLNQTHGTTILVSSYILGQVEHIADTIGVLSGGRLVTEMPLESIRKEAGHFTEIKCRPLEKAAFLIEERFQITNFRVLEKDCIRIYEQDIDREMLLRELILDGVLVREFTVRERSLEDYFVDAMQRLYS